jgi:hypothetical protein
MTRHNSEQKNGDSDHQRSGGGGTSSHPPDNGPVANVDKLEKDSKSDHDEPPVEQHRSSRRPRQRKQNSH